MTSQPGSHIKWLNYALLALILGVALVMRLEHLNSVQRFFGDQSAFYNTIMNWKQDGAWPLLGPYRSVGGDSTIGPGWYYLIAPALWLSHFSLGAGAATVGVIGILGVFLAWLWVWRTSGSAPAALATAVVLGFSTAWIINDRMVYNPSVMPFTVVALACLIEGLERRPVACLALYLMLLAVLPQWHTVGIPIAAASLAPAGWALVRGRGRWRESSRRSRVVWGLALAAVLMALYLPPVIYEMKSSRSNMRNYIKNTFLPAPPQTKPLPQRAAEGTDRVIRMVAEYNFNIRTASQARPVHLWVVAALGALAFAGVALRRLLRDWRTFPPSLLFLCFILGGLWLLAVLNGENVLSYFLWPALGVPVLLGGWTAGELLRLPEGSGGAGGFSPRLAGRLAGVLLLAFGLTLSARQFPQAWRQHDGRYSAMGFGLRDSTRIARAIAARVEGPQQPVSLLFTDAPGSSPAYLHVILRTRGVRTLNSRVNLNQPTPRAFLGETLFVVVRGALEKAPQIKSPAPIQLGKPERVADAWIYRIPVASLPAQTKAVRVYSQKPRWFFEVVTK